jgi:ribosomal-protein-alanine N-acetyltransferase
MGGEKMKKNVHHEIKTPIITERLILRKLTRDDFDNIYSLCLQSKTNDWSPGWDMSKEEASNFLDWQINKYEKFDVVSDMVPFAIELKSESLFIGHCHVGNHDELNETEIAYGIEKCHRGKGYATEVAEALIKWTFQAVGLPYVVATILPDNIASLKVIEKAGFTNCGNKRLKYMDTKRDFCYFRYYNQLSSR